MNTFLYEMESVLSTKLTENGALTYSSSLNKVLDLFALGGSYRGRTDDDIVFLFDSAYVENKALAVACLFYLRDVRGGQGERRFFRVVLEKSIDMFVADFGSERVHKLLKLIAEYGRWDDLLCILEKSDLVVSIFKEQLEKDILECAKKAPKGISLLAKWLPSVNTSSANTRKKAQYLATKLGMSEKKYRKTLSMLRSELNILEKDMSTNSWGTIDYEKVPSQAMIKHRKAFTRHDEERYTEYKACVASGEKTVNTATLYPYQIADKVLAGAIERSDADMLWNNLPDYVPSGMSAIAVVDVSGSMYSGSPTAVSVAISLGLYLAQKNTGAFEGKFITFSEKPQLVSVDTKGSIVDAIDSMHLADWGYNTNLNAVFDVFLKAASAPGVQRSDIPNTIIIISDMEFDYACGMTNYKLAESKFKAAGVEMPNVVFWNVMARNDTIPVRKNQHGTLLVSGFSPVTFRYVVEGTTPEQFMLSVLGKERYKVITNVLVE